jgi:release factor glutamine methyltransferase
MLNKEEEWLLREKYGGEKSEAFFAACQQLKNGTPLAYLIGHIPFLNTKIYLNTRPLIPRPETEFWVEKAIGDMAKIADGDKPFKVLDLCAGSGCIGIAVAKKYPLAHIDFVELDRKHQDTIKKNCLENNIGENNYRIFVGDLFSPLTGDTYDFILSNPPYIDPILNRVEKTVKDHEPSLALYGGNLGTELLEKIITEAPKHLKFQGQLWLEHEPEQAEIIFKLAENNFTTTTHKDQYQVLRFSQLVLK